MTTKLWVQHQTTERTFGPSRVSIQDCEYVDDFLIKLYDSPILSILRDNPITLYKPDGSTEIDVGDSISDYLDGNSRNNPLIVKSTRISSRQKTTRKMAVEASCRKYLDAMARQISGFYDFDFNPRYGATMGNVLAAKDGKEGQDWWFRLAKKTKTFTEIDMNGFKRVVKKGQKLASCPLPELFQPDEWKKISEFNDLTSGRVHSGVLPVLSDGRAYIIIPSHIYSDETVAFLKDIGVRSFLLSDPGALVVKNEDTLSESSFTT